MIYDWDNITHLISSLLCKLNFKYKTIYHDDIKNIEDDYIYDDV